MLKEGKVGNSTSGRTEAPEVDQKRLGNLLPQHPAEFHTCALRIVSDGCHSGR